MKFLGKSKYERQKYKSKPSASNVNEQVSEHLQENIDYIHQLFNLAPTLTFRSLHVEEKESVVVYFSELVDEKVISEFIISPLIEQEQVASSLSVSVGQVTKEANWTNIVEQLLNGKSILFVDGHVEAWVLSTIGGVNRNIEDSVFETTLKGSHLGFVEEAERNIALIRRFLPTTDLKIVEMTIGTQYKNTVYLLYLESVVNDEYVSEMKERLSAVKMEGLLNIGQIAELIEDNQYSPFPQFILTERPDFVSLELLEGRVCVVLDRSPSTLIAPSSIMSFLKSVDDYTTRWMSASFIRMLRFLALGISIFLPAIYIAIISFNYEIVPIRLLVTIGDSRAQVPFDPLIEALIMEVTLEMLREAGIRLPSPIGQTVGIVGGIVIGQAAVEAGIVSNLMVIVVSLTAISSFIIPNYDMSIGVRLLRFPMMVIASMFGIVGVVIGLMTLIGHVISLDSLRTPYGLPFAPVTYKEWKDSIVRLPLKKQKGKN
ncbi:spore germination protein [Bacillus sp. CGMCC 1.16541]|uniref:spore germination protein n=1 Tax=Bacillus sp. CGMCC 1.16541 TaxID=2185143 RepID=UPI0013A530CB|nr:spore germination protein [Bacillus sp. CGMCC 1.16541]